MYRKLIIFLTIYFIFTGDVSALEIKEWNKNWFDLRIIDIPQVGNFYNFDDRGSLLFRVSTPLTFPVILITPITATYASSYWGVSGLLMDITFGLNILELKPSDSILLRCLPVSIWGGIPLSSNGMGLYILFETVPINLFNSAKDNFKNIYFGLGINTGIKYIISEHIELELKYENYFAYTDFEIWNKYIGITFKYRIFDPRYYGIW
jgi:hypothetical protein